MGGGRLELYNSSLGEGSHRTEKEAPDGPQLSFRFHPRQGLSDSRSRSPCLWWREAGTETSPPTGRRADHWVSSTPLVGREETPGRQSKGPSSLARRGFRPPPPLLPRFWGPEGPEARSRGSPVLAGAAPRKSGVSAGQAIAAVRTTGEGRTGRAACGPRLGCESRVRPGSAGWRTLLLGCEGSAPTGSPGARARARAPPLGVGWGRRQPELPAPADTPTQCLGGASRNRQRRASARTARREAPRVRAASLLLASALGRAGRGDELSPRRRGGRSLGVPLASPRSP